MTEQNVKKGVDMKLSKEEIVERIENGSLNYKKLPAHLRDVREIAMAIVSHNKDGLGNISHRLQNDIVVVTEAIKFNPMSLEYASERLRGHEEIVMLAMHLNKDSAAFATDKVKEPQITKF